MPQGFIPLCSNENSGNTQNHHFPISIFFFKKINLELGNTADFCGDQPLLTFFSFGVLLLFIYCLRFPWGTKSHLRISQCYHNVNDLMYRSSRWNRFSPEGKVWPEVHRQRQVGHFWWKWGWCRAWGHMRLHRPYVCECIHSNIS